MVSETEKVFRLKRIAQIAESNGGKCLSKSYTTSKAKYKFQCSKNHIWLAQACQIVGRSNRTGSWCPKCVIEAKKDNIETFIKIAKKKGGECLSKKYINSQTKIRFRCREGHTWDALPGNIKNGNAWCLKCTGNEKKDIQFFRKLAKEKGFECLEKKYINIHSSMSWKCRNNHTWKAPGADIKKGRGCPVCSSGAGERICRLYFEKIFNKKFPKSRPSWLSTTIRDPQELDGFCEELGLAFEHHGRQHYEFLKKWHIDKKGFELQQRKDQLRRKRCLKNSVVLIEIPEIGWKHGLKLQDLPSFLLKEFKRNNIKITKDIHKIKIDLATAFNPDNLEEYKELAELKGGKCLSLKYTGSKNKHEWECDKGHTWFAPPSSIKAGNWCPKCIGRNGTICEMQELARSKGGVCLSKTYVNSNKKLKWSCREGHIWLATPTAIKFKSWCPSCAQLKSIGQFKHSIKVLQTEAKNRGGKCLSKVRLSSKDRLRWKCSNGHIWEASPNSIMRGSWCGICSQKKTSESRKLTVEDMQELAKAKGGECLSEKYINSKTKLKWKCSSGHVWSAVPTSIKRDSWCPQCGIVAAGEKKKYSLKDLNEFAKKREGKVLSKKYISCNDKIKWQCRRNHIWMSSFEYVKFREKKRGNWCPLCKKIEDMSMSAS